MNNLARLGLVYLAVVGLLAACSVAFLCVLPPPPSFAAPAVIEFEPGTSTRVMAEHLESQGVITSRWLFLAVRLLRPRSTLMAGEYRFEQPLSVWEAFDRIAAGRVMYHPVTIPEGFNRFEVADAMAETGLIDREAFLQETASAARVADRFPDAETLEGFLFPDTYYLVRHASAAGVVDMMTQRFEVVFSEAMKDASASLTPFEIVKMASLIEKETPLPREHRLVSSVFHNRLQRGMLLQCDPTVVYGLVLEERFRGWLSQSDLADPHRYNTYVHPGLPPGPIANPGREALRAAVNPLPSEYLYFVAQANGEGHVFSRSLGAHNRAVAQYRRSRAR